MDQSSIRIESKAGETRILLAGDLGADEALDLWKRIRPQVVEGRGQVTFDLAAVTSLDGGTAALLGALKHDAESKGRSVDVQGADVAVAEHLNLYLQPSCATLHEPPIRIGFLDQIGKACADVAARVRNVLSFVGEFSLAVSLAFRRPRSIPWRDFGPLLERSGADGLPIVILINFLVGLIMGIQAAIQLHRFGADIFVADLVGLGMTRELGPLMTAIIVAGRSGAGFAAELGTMKVSEEVDALRTMGFCPYCYLVLPRILALAIAVPILTLFADIAGILGGLTVGVGLLDLTVRAYLIQTQTVMDLWDVGSGLIKAFVFGLLIAVVACQQGLGTQGGASGVGRSTTRTVVTILFSLVLLDAGFTLVFRLFGL